MSKSVPHYLHHLDKSRTIETSCDEQIHGHITREGLAKPCKGYRLHATFPVHGEGLPSAV